jgi:hypothetical protein
MADQGFSIAAPAVETAATKGTKSAFADSIQVKTYVTNKTGVAAELALSWAEGAASCNMSGCSESRLASGG